MFRAGTFTRFADGFFFAAALFWIIGVVLKLHSYRNNDHLVSIIVRKYLTWAVVPLLLAPVAGYFAFGGWAIVVMPIIAGAVKLRPS